MLHYVQSAISHWDINLYQHSQKQGESFSVVLLMVYIGKFLVKVWFASEFLYFFFLILIKLHCNPLSVSTPHSREIREEFPDAGLNG